MRASRIGLLAIFSVGIGVTVACVGDSPTTIVTPSSDASTPVVDGNTGVDATASDAGVGVDTGISPGVDSGPKRYCDTQSTPPDASDFFCADFDGTNFEQGFIDASVTEGGTLNQDPSVFVSSPNSINTQIASVKATSAYLVWQRGGPDVVNHLKLSAEVKENTVETLGSPNGVIELLTLNVGTSPTVYSVAFVYAFNQLNQSNNMSFTGYALMIILPTEEPVFYSAGPLAGGGGFTTVELDYDGTAHQAQVFFNGSTVLLEPFSSLTGNLAVQALVGSNSINIGTTALQGQWNIDNATLTTSE